MLKRSFALFNFLTHCLVLPFFSSKLWFRCLWCSGGGGDGEEERGKEEKKGLLGERKSCIWGGFFVTFGFCFCHVSFFSFKMGENGRLQDWRGAGANNQVKCYFALGFAFHLNVTQNYMKVSLLFPLNFPVFTLFLKKSQLCGYWTPILISLLITKYKQ